LQTPTEPPQSKATSHIINRRFICVFYTVRWASGRASSL